MPFWINYPIKFAQLHVLYGELWQKVQCFDLQSTLPPWPRVAETQHLVNIKEINTIYHNRHKVMLCFIHPEIKLRKP